MRSSHTSLPFVKYQSLKNDFCIIDERAFKLPLRPFLSSTDGQAWVQKLCDRRCGVGADGLLVLSHPKDTSIELEATIYNQDGSLGALCLNGIRCIAHHYFTQTQAQSLTLAMGPQHVVCTAQREGNISLLIGGPLYGGVAHITCGSQGFSGHVIDVGNPHFVIFQSVNKATLNSYGAQIQTHPRFPHGVNVEFATKQSPCLYKMLIYERGCGPTPACSSGVLALIFTLTHMKAIKPREQITICMPGGTIGASLNDDGRIQLFAPAYYCFTGSIDAPQALFPIDKDRSLTENKNFSL